MGIKAVATAATGTKPTTRGQTHCSHSFPDMVAARFRTDVIHPVSLVKRFQFQ